MNMQGGSERVLVLAPHADDETLGVGGTVSRHVENGDHVTVAIATGRGEIAHPVVPDEVFTTVKAEALSAMARLGVQDVRFLNLPTVVYPQDPIWETNKRIGDVVTEIEPTVLYVPYLYDLHNDHRALFRAANVAWRPSTATGRRIRSVLAYEVQSETHWNPAYLEPGFTPNHWVSLEERHVRAKLEALAEYKSQMHTFPHARSVKACENLLRWRGSQQGMAAAEAFVVVRSFG